MRRRSWQRLGARRGGAICRRTALNEQPAKRSCVVESAGNRAIGAEGTGGEPCGWRTGERAAHGVAKERGAAGARLLRAGGLRVGA